MRALAVTELWEKTTLLEKASMSELLVIHRRGFASLLNAIRENWSGRWSVWSPEAASPMPTAAAVVFVCCDHPDAFRGISAEILSAFPLAEVWIVTGPWLRAIGRTRSHWPASWLITEAQAIERLTEISAGSPATPHPPTWSRDERFLAEETCRSQPPGRPSDA